MSVHYNRGRDYITEDLAGDQEKWDRLLQLLEGRVNVHHILAQPTDEFYTLSLPDMAKAMLVSIGVETGDDQIRISFNKKMKESGRYFEHRGVHYIQVRQSYAGRPLEAAAILAHQLMHYVLVGGLNYRLARRFDNEQLTDMATIYAGLGVVVLNGFDRSSGNKITSLRFFHRSRSKSFGYYLPKEYAEIVAAFIEENNIARAVYAGYVTPNVARFLPKQMGQVVRSASDRTAIIVGARRRYLRKRTILITLIVVVLGVGVWLFIATTRGLSPQAQRQVTSLKAIANSATSEYSVCEVQLRADKGVLDATNIQMQTYSQQGDSTDYGRLISQHNQQNNTYNEELGSCGALHAQQTSAVSAYDQHVSHN